MLPIAAISVGGGLVAATAPTTARSQTVSADVHPHVQPTQTPAINTEDGVTELDLRDDRSIFSGSEIDQTVEEIVGIWDQQPSSEAQEGGHASSLQVNQTTVRERHFMTGVFRASQRMVSNTGVQKAAVQALKDDDLLADMIEDLGNFYPDAEAVEVDRTDVEEETPLIEMQLPVVLMSTGSAMGRLFQDVFRHLRTLWHAVEGIVGTIAAWLQRAFSWLWRSIKKTVSTAASFVKDAAEESAHVLPWAAAFIRTFGRAGRAGPIVTLCAMIIIILMTVRRRQQHIQQNEALTDA